MTAKLRAVLILAALSLVGAWTVNAQAQLPSLSIDDVEQEEGSGHRFVGFADAIALTPFVFTVTLSQPSANTVTVTYKARSTTVDNQFPYDFHDASGVLTFAPGETEKNITVQVEADFNDEATETFVVELSDATNATIDKGVGNGTILNDDTAPTNSDLALEIISGSTVHVGEYGTITFRVTNNGPEDITNVVWAIRQQQVTATPSQGEGCGHIFGGEGDGDTHCYLGTIASGNTATVTMGVKIPPYCTDDTPSYNKFWLSDAMVDSDTNTDHDHTNDRFSINYYQWVDVQPIVTPSTMDLAAGSTQSLTVQVDLSYGGSTLDMSADDNCISVPATVVTSTTSPYPATIPVTAVSAPCIAHVMFKSRSCTPVYSVPVTTHAASTAVAFSFNPPSPVVTAGQTLHVHVTASPLSAPGSFVLTSLSRTIDVPSSVVIDPVTGGDIAITGMIGGVFSLTITAPAGLGSTSSTLSGLVLDVPPPPPIGLSGVSPNSGSTNGGTLVRASGLGFTSDCWPFFDGLAARNVIFEGTTSLVAATPRHGAGTVSMSLRCSGAADATLSNALTYVAGDDPAPLITSVDPLAAASGQQVTIHGLHFRTTDTITFGSVAAISGSSAPDAHVATVPSLPAGLVSVSVTDILGRLSTTGPIFTILDSSPQITRISPTPLPAGAELTIDGSGFRAPYTFTIGGQTARIVTLSFNRAVVRVPALAPGGYEVRVVNGGGQTAASGGTVTVTQSGVLISGDYPVCARTNGGSVIHILGNGFGAAATVTIGGTAATNVTVIDASHIDVTLPPLPPGRATIVVRNTSGESATATNAVVVYSPFDPDGCPVSARQRATRN